MIVVGCEKGRDADDPVSARRFSDDHGLSQRRESRSAKSRALKSVPLLLARDDQTDRPMRPVGGNDSRTPARDGARRRPTTADGRLEMLMAISFSGLA